MRVKRKVSVGNISIGGDAPITIQSMTNTHTGDADATIAQIRSLADAGCDIVRLAVCDEADLTACKKIVSSVKVPLVADIQFDYKLAVACSELGFGKVRFNPGNIGNDENVRKLTEACKANGTPIRVGVNAGSLQKDILDKYGRTPQALCESALRHVALLEKYGFYDTVVSVKASDLYTCTQAYRLLDEKCDYPLHIGITESGAKFAGTVKSAIGIGSLLLDGIGNTIRVSLTGDPLAEVIAAKQILLALKKRQGCEIVSCPTCSRCNINLAEIYDKVLEMVSDIPIPLKIAVMGCVVNGPGEAADADFGVAGGKNGKSVIFSHGKICKTVPDDQIVGELRKLMEEAIAK